MPLVAGADSSTSACKVDVRDADTGALVASGRAAHPPTLPPRSEQDPRAWRAAFEEAGAGAGLLGPHRPAAIAVAAQQHGLVVTDRAGEPLRPAKLWNDTESAPDAAELVAALPGGPSAWAQACGSVPTAAFTISKLRWLRRCEPATFRRLERVMLPHDWLTGQLTGAWSTDRGDASGTGWWSPATGCYRLDLLELVDPSVPWPELLPAVLDPEGAAGAWPETGAVVGPGTGDNMAAALGLGLAPGDLALSLGTSGTAFCVRDRPTADAGGAVAGFADASGRFLPLVCTLNATGVTDAVAGLLGLSAGELAHLALAAAPGAGGLVLVPYLDGERTPNRPTATGLLAGLRRRTTREQLARAAVEGVLCGLLEGAAHLGPGPSGQADGRLVLTGGGARSPAFRQVLADLSGRVVTAVVEEEPVARGAAVQAAAVLRGTTVRRVAETWAPMAALPVEPTPGADGTAVREAYRAAVDR